MSILTFSIFFFFSSRRRHTRYWRDWSSDVCSSDLRSILTILSTNGSSRNSPGPLGPPWTRPRRKMAPRSYSFTTFTALYKNEATTTTTTTSAMNAKLTPTACNKPKVAYMTNPPLSARLVEISTATGRSDGHHLHHSSLAEAQDPHPVALGKHLLHAFGLIADFRHVPSELVISMSEGRHAGDEAGAGGGHEEHCDYAKHDGRRPQPPRAEEVA